MSQKDLTGKRAALYIRVSSEEQAKHGLSLDEQEHELKQYANDHGAIIAGIYRDEGTTARKKVHLRKELQRLLRDVREGLIDVILVIKLDRWFRNVADFYKVQELLDKCGVGWIATQEQNLFDTTTSNGRYMFNNFLNMAQYESDRTSERIRYVFAGKKRRGEMISGGLPYGYCAKNKHIVIDETTADNVRDIFKYFTLSQSVRETAAYVKKKYNLQYAPSGMRRLLQNPGYIGTFYQRENYIPALIDWATWDKVQTILHEPRRMEVPRKPRRPYLFTGLIYCPVCGRKLSGRTILQRYNGRHDDYKAYTCPRHVQERGACSFGGYLGEKAIETYLLDNIANLLHDYQTTLTKGARCAGRQVKDVQRKLDRLKDLYVEGFIDRDTYKKDFSRYNKQLQIAINNQQSEPKRKPTRLMMDILHKGVKSLYVGLSQAEKRKFWHAIIKAIYITHFESGKGGKKDFSVVFW